MRPTTQTPLTRIVWTVKGAATTATTTSRSASRSGHSAVDTPCQASLSRTLHFSQLERFIYAGRAQCAKSCTKLAASVALVVSISPHSMAQLC